MTPEKYLVFENFGVPRICLFTRFQCKTSALNPVAMCLLHISDKNVRLKIHISELLETNILTFVRTLYENINIFQK